MAEIGGEPVAAAAPQEDAEEQPASKPKRKKKGQAAAADTEDIDALLAQLDGPPDQQAATSSEAAAAAEPAAEAGKGKKKKKKGKGGAKDEEDLDAVLAELGMAPAPKSEAQPSTDAQPQVSEAAAPADEAAPAADGEGPAEEDGNDAAAAEDGKVCILVFCSVFFDMLFSCAVRQTISCALGHAMPHQLFGTFLQGSGLYICTLSFLVILGDMVTLRLMPEQLQDISLFGKDDMTFRCLTLYARSPYGSSKFWF